MNGVDMSIVFRPRAVLFDLDGTLADTAPDLGGALNVMRERRGLAAMPIAELRPWASAGARGLLHVGLQAEPEHHDFETLRQEFLDIYEGISTQHSTLFDGVDELLAGLEARRLAWGVVTNKPKRFTPGVLKGLGLGHRAAVAVSGDTTPHAKPHPAPLLHACEQLGIVPSAAIYVGDDLRDIQAARAAGMPAVAAGYGYIGQSDIEHWHADVIIDRPQDLLKLLAA